MIDFTDPENFSNQIIEFCKMIYNDKTVENEFNILDKNYDDYLDKNELGRLAKQVLNSYYKEFSKPEREAVVDKWVEKFDINKDQKISIDEFKDLMETVYSKFIMDELANIQKDPDCPKPLKELDLCKNLTDKLPSLSKEDQEIIKKFIEKAKKEI